MHGDVLEKHLVLPRLRTQDLLARAELVELCLGEERRVLGLEADVLGGVRGRNGDEANLEERPRPLDLALFVQGSRRTYQIRSQTPSSRRRGLRPAATYAPCSLGCPAAGTRPQDVRDSLAGLPVSDGRTVHRFLGKQQQLDPLPLPVGKLGIPLAWGFERTW